MKTTKFTTLSALSSLVAALLLPGAAQASVIPSGLYSVTSSAGTTTSTAGAVTFNNFDDVNLTAIATVSGGLLNGGANTGVGGNWNSAVGAGGGLAEIDIRFTGQVSYFGLYWGTNDGSLNTVSLYRNGQLRATVTGTTLNGVSGYTNIFANNVGGYFDEVVLGVPGANGCCFETDNYAAKLVNATEVPEPAALGLVGSGLFLLALSRRRNAGQHAN